MRNAPFLLQAGTVYRWAMHRGTAHRGIAHVGLFTLGLHALGQDTAECTGGLHTLEDT